MYREASENVNGPGKPLETLSSCFNSNTGLRKESPGIYQIYLFLIPHIYTLLISPPSAGRGLPAALAPRYCRRIHAADPWAYTPAYPEPHFRRPDANCRSTVRLEREREAQRQPTTAKQLFVRPSPSGRRDIEVNMCYEDSIAIPAKFFD
eukprot:1368371-Amorphochlora_amoeboformis.AAC.2